MFAQVVGDGILEVSQTATIDKFTQHSAWRRSRTSVRGNGLPFEAAASWREDPEYLRAAKAIASDLELENVGSAKNPIWVKSFGVVYRLILRSGVSVR